MALKLKAGVSLVGMVPQLTVALMAAQPYWDAVGADFVITSCNDGRHSRTSLHYAGAAIDVRTRNLSMSGTEKHMVAKAISDALGPDFDVLFEGGGTGNEHIHLEWQPKRPPG